MFLYPGKIHAKFHVSYMSGVQMNVPFVLYEMPKFEVYAHMPYINYP